MIVGWLSSSEPAEPRTLYSLANCRLLPVISTFSPLFNKGVMKLSIVEFQHIKTNASRFVRKTEFPIVVDHHGINEFHAIGSSSGRPHWCSLVFR